MPASLASIRREAEMAIEPSPRDKGVTLTLKVTAYDTGLINVGDRPMAGEHEEAWLGAATHIMFLLQELRAQSARRQQQ